MLRVIAAGLALFFPAAAMAAGWTKNLDPPPDMGPNPLVVENVCPEDARWPTLEQGAGRFIRVTLPRDHVCEPRVNGSGGVVSVLGGTAGNPAKGVWVTGGKIVNVHGQKGRTRDEDRGQALLRFQGVANGTILVEGVEFDARGTCEDIMHTVHMGPDVKMLVQNVRAGGAVHCGKGGTHGDIVHAQGTGRQHELKVQNGWFEVRAQGLFGDVRSKLGRPLGHGWSRLETDHVTFFSTGDYKHPEPGYRGPGWVMAWQDKDGPPVQGVFFRETYLDSGSKPWADTFRYATMPRPAGYQNGCAIYGQSNGVREGTWCQGKPPKGDPAPESMVGLNYDRAKFTGDPPPEDETTPVIVTDALGRVFNLAVTSPVAHIIRDLMTEYLDGR